MNIEEGDLIIFDKYSCGIVSSIGKQYIHFNNDICYIQLSQVEHVYRKMSNTYVEVTDFGTGKTVRE